VSRDADEDGQGRGPVTENTTPINLQLINWQVVILL